MKLLFPLPLFVSLPFIGGLLAFSAAGCAGSLAKPQAEDLAIASRRFGGVVSLSQLEHGRARYVDKCSSCHSLHHPEEFAAEKWPALVDEMVVDAHLEGDDRDSIVRYLVTMSDRQRLARPVVSTAAADAPSPAR